MCGIVESGGSLQQLSFQFPIRLISSTLIFEAPCRERHRPTAAVPPLPPPSSLHNSAAGVFGSSHASSQRRRRRNKHKKSCAFFYCSHGICVAPVFVRLTSQLTVTNNRNNKKTDFSTCRLRCSLGTLLTVAGCKCLLSSFSGSRRERRTY